MLNLWGFTFNNLNFDYHVNQLCKKASKKRHALARIAEYMDINKRRMVMKAFVSSQFSNCPVIMIYSRKMEHRINSIHMRDLKFVFDDSRDFMFQELLAKSRSNYTLCLKSNYTLERKRGHTVYQGSESISSLALKLGDLLSNLLKTSASLEEFKTKINTWTTDHCPCRICKKCWESRIHFRFFHPFN